VADLFDSIDAGEQAKEAGIAAASANKASLLRFAQDLAIKVALARPDRCVTADDIQAALVAAGISEHALGNAAGSLFRAKGWVWTGRLVKSCRVHAHRNLLRVWFWNPNNGDAT
jgi:hypothetical protein